MSNVTLTIGGRDYAIACDVGEEAHIAELGQMIHAKLDPLPPASKQSDARALLFAALLLADEVFELRKTGEGQPRPDPLPGAAQAATPAGSSVQPEQLDALAARLEALAAALEVSV